MRAGWKRWIGACGLGAVLALGPSMASAQHNWPQFLGPTGNAHATADSLPLKWSETENVRWKTPIHGKGWSSPVVWESQVWLTTATEDGHKLYALCLDKETGKVVHDLLLFEVEKPSEIHNFNSYASPTPVIEDGRVYITFGSYGTACLDTATAQVIWQRRDLPCEHFRGPGSSPILYKNLFILHYDGFDYQYVAALNKETGETVWKVDRDVEYGSPNGDFKKAFCTPTLIEVDGQTQLISPTSKASIAYDPDTGKELWRIRYNEFSATVKPVYGHGLVFINTGFGKAALHAVRPTGTGDVTESLVAWSATKAIPSKPTHLLVDDLLYMVHDNGTATCLEAESGKVVWQQRIGGNYTATPLYWNGRIYFFSQEGKVTVAKTGREYEELASFDMGDGYMASPAVSDNAIYLRTRSALYRIEAAAE